ncbi:sensor domain-containing diguanylate cyclase [Ornithinibacillus californiensis]|uniref:sensor domain-containing diguanylate cyclase n=1 Tax=Ornithinibacillus californiensis TaxID=161536 RepID=UPI00069D8669|nr:sensor domain-containing diguanylate cyclase [Ornithinibacillus californiensis]
MKEKILREKLKLMNYDLLTSVSPNSKEYFYEKLSKKISDILSIDFTGIYLYDDWNKHFKLASESDLLAEYVYDPQLTCRKSIVNGETSIKFNKNNFILSSYTDIDILPLTLSNGPMAIIVLGVALNDAITENMKMVLREEIENGLLVANDILQTKINEERNRILFELTAKFLVLNNKTDILTEIITSARKFYPDYDYYLLLSQDHDESVGLPIKAMELGDNSTNLASSQAFLKGEVQIEEIDHKHTCVYAPLKGFQGVYGVVQIIAPSKNVFSKDDLDFISKFANTAGKAIESTILYQNSTHLVSDLILVNDLTHQLNSNLELKEITKLVRDQIFKICQAEEIGFVYRMQETTQDFETIDGSTSFFNSVEGRGFTRHLVAEMLKRKEAIFYGDYKHGDGNVPYHAMMVLPMENAGLINGIAIILHKNPYAFSFDQFKLLQSIIRHSTLAFVNTILKDQLQKLVSTDYLTKLYARNYLDEKISEHMNSGETGTLILFDIDNFKQVNDSFGHFVGDEVIKQVAEIIKSTIEKKDIAARWGGEELAVYLPGTEINEGVQIARNINTQVENFTEPRVTLSAGVSSWTSTNEDSARSFFIRADKALYEAKSYGKNCVVKYSLKDQEKDKLRL